MGKRRKKKYVKEKRIHKVKTREWWRKKGEDEPKPLYCTTNKTKHKKIYTKRITYRVVEERKKGSQLNHSSKQQQ